MNACEVCGDTPVCKTGLCPACTIDLWTGQTELKMQEADNQFTYSSEHESRVKQPINIQSENRNSSVFLGVTVAERVLSNVFKNVVRASFGNPGFDFTCSKGMKIDVKAACLPTKPKSTIRWGFKIKHNQIADYFLCLAFDNRTDLNPLHLWLIPGEKVNHASGLTISQSTIHKWQKYELPLNKTIACCDTFRPLM